MSSSRIVSDKKLVDLPNTSTYQVVQLEGNGAGRDDIFAAITSGIADVEYMDSAKSIFTPVLDFSTRPHMEEEIDIPCEVGAGVFGKQVRCKIGHQGPTLLGDVALHIKVTCADSFVGSVTNCELVPFFAEFILGDQFRIQYANNTVRQYTREVQHMFNRIMCDDRDYKDTAYRQRVGAHEVDRTIAAGKVFEFSVPLWQPFKQMANRYDHMFLAGGHADELIYSFKFPRFEELFRASIPLDGDGAGDTPPSNTWSIPATDEITIDLQMRAKFQNVLKAERAALITKVQSAGGIARTILSPEWQDQTVPGIGAQTIAVNSSVLVARTSMSTAGAAENLVKIDLKNLINPCALLSFMVRYSVDLEAAVTSGFSAANLPRPDWTAMQPYRSYHLRENGKRFLIEHTMKQVREDEWPRYLNSRPVDGIGLISFCEHPSIQNYGSGHVTLSTMTNPQLWISLDNRPAAVTGRAANNGLLISQGTPYEDEEFYSQSTVSLAPNSSDPWQRSYHNTSADYLDDNSLLDASGPNNIVPLDGASEFNLLPVQSKNYNKQVFVLSFARNKLHSERSETLEYYRS